MQEDIKKIEFQIAKEKIKRGITAMFYLSFPVIIAFLIWGIWFDPITYWQKVFSFLGGIVTWFVVFYIEIEVFK